MIHLLDVNVLVALVDENHRHHSAALQFFPKVQASGWATCPIVQNGFLRIVGNPNYPDGPGSPEAARRILLPYLAAPGHQFWPDDLSLTDPARFPSLATPHSLTDLYLLGLAVKRSGCLATFDRSINPSLIPGGSGHFLLLAA